MQTTRAIRLREGPGCTRSTAASRTPLAAAVLLGLASMPWAHAATIIVTSPGDTDPGAANTCTLRQAIGSMNASTLSGNCQNTGDAFGTGDRINFASGINTITLADAWMNGLVVQTPDLTIDAGAGRIVTIERASGGTNGFSVIKGLTGHAAGGEDYVPGRLTLIGLTIQNGRGDGDFSKYGLVGGGVAAHHTHLTLERCVIRANQADAGGGVYVTGNGSLTLRSTRISDNDAFELAGGIGSTSTILVQDSTLDGNLAPTGGAIVSARGSISLVNSTVSGNVSAQAGSAILQVNINNQHGPITILNSTITCNNAQGGAAIQAMASPQLGISVFSSILANTSHAACTTATTAEIAVVDGTVVVGGNRNLLASSSAIDASAPFANTPSFGNPQLGPLQDNGGPTPTRSPNVGSPAVEAGGNPNNLANDQRGAPHPRKIGFGPDIGAVERPYVGLCGSAHGQSFTNVTPGTPNLCAAGAFLQSGLIFGTGPWSWFCASVSIPDNNEFCRASVLANVSLAVTDTAGTPISTPIYGEPIRLRATVAGGASLPAGTVSIFDASFSAAIALCTDVPLVAGAGTASATCEVSGNRPEAGPRLLKAVYNGNATYGSVSSAGTPITVQRATSTTLGPATDPQPSTVGSPFTAFTFVQITLPSLANASGTLVLQDLTDGLSCTYDFPTPEPGCELIPVSVGMHDLVATFPGDGNILPSSGTITHAVQFAPTTTTIEPPSAIAFGESIEISASVGSTAALDPPTGSILVSGADALCTIELGTATHCTLTPMAHGTLPLSATYSGDARYAASSATGSIDVVPHSIGGLLGGLLPGNALTLQLAWNGNTETLALSGDDPFAFVSVLPAGAPYVVSVMAQPADPEQFCTVTNGSGTMGSADIDDVAVQCIDSIFVDGFDP